MNSKRENRPGLISSTLLRLFTEKDQRSEILGDFEEIFNSICREKGIRSANSWYRTQMLKSIPVFIKIKLIWSKIMLLNYIRTALRSILKHKTNSFLNITGLAIGMACSLLIMLWTVDELNYDGYHKDAERTYRIDSVMTYAGKRNVWPVAPDPLCDALAKDFPEIEKFTKLARSYNTTINSDEKKFYEDQLVYATPSFFKMFSVTRVDNKPIDGFKDPNSIYITQKTAAKYFGKEDPLNKTLVINGKHSFSVAGVIKDFPHNTHIRPEFIIDYKNTEKMAGNSHQWGIYDYFNYITLKKNVDPAAFQKKIRFYIKKIQADNTVEFKMVPVKNIHLNPDNGSGNKTYLYAFSITGIMILLIACINFINLTTASSTVKEKEIGLRKILGAHRGSLISQVYAESLILTLAAYLISTLAVTLLLPVFSDFTGKEFSFTSLFTPVVLAGQFIILFMTGLIAGSYPAFVLSSAKAVQTIKVYASSGSKGGLIRKTLIVVQFSISICLIICTLNINNQLNYLRNKELGFDKAQLMYLKFNREDVKKIDAIKQNIQALPEVKHASASNRVPVNLANFSNISRWDGNDGQQRVMFNILMTDQDFIKTMGFKMSEGSAFTKHTLKDSIIVNETALKKTGITNPLGKKIFFWGANRTIIGVVKDFHFNPLSQSIRPLIITFNKDHARSFLMIKAGPGNIKKTVDAISRAYRKTVPNSPLALSFVDESLDEQYRNEQKTGTLINIFSILAIFTSCLGLFGLSLFTARRRIKEIGIRKVLGAKVTSLVASLSGEFLLLIVIANLIAWPLGYTVISKWLENYVYKTDISIATFLISMISATVIGILTISYHTISAANTDPVKCIKDE